MNRKVTDDEKRFIYKHRYELNAKQIGSILGINYGTVRNYLSKVGVARFKKDPSGRYMAEPLKRGRKRKTLQE